MIQEKKHWSGTHFSILHLGNTCIRALNPSILFTINRMIKVRSIEKSIRETPQLFNFLFSEICINFSILIDNFSTKLAYLPTFLDNIKNGISFYNTQNRRVVGIFDIHIPVVINYVLRCFIFDIVIFIETVYILFWNCIHNFELYDIFKVLCTKNR